MMPLRVVRASNALKILVGVGLVVGTIPAIIPTGSAIFLMPNSGSDSIAPPVFSSL